MKKITLNPDSEYDLLPIEAKSGINIKKSHRGLLHKNLGVPQGQLIPASKLSIKSGDSPAVRKRKQFAINAKKFNHGQNGLDIPEAQYQIEDYPQSTDYQPQLSPIEDLDQKGLLEPYRQNEYQQLPVSQFQIKNNKFDWKEAGNAASNTLLALDAFIPRDKPKYPTVQPQSSYNPHAYGTGSQAISKYGSKISNMGYKANSPDRGYASLTVPSNQITMEGVPHDVYGIDDTGYSQLMRPGKNYQFPGNSVQEFPMRAQNGASLQQANMEAKRFAIARGLVSGENTYVDHIPQYTDIRTGKPYTGEAGVTNTYVPPGINRDDIQPNIEGIYSYPDPKTGDLIPVNSAILNSPRFKPQTTLSTKAPTINNSIAARMKNGGQFIPGLTGNFSVRARKTAKNGSKLQYMEGQTYNLEDDEIQNLLDSGYELKYEQ